MVTWMDAGYPWILCTQDDVATAIMEFLTCYQQRAMSWRRSGHLVQRWALMTWAHGSAC